MDSYPWASNLSNETRMAYGWGAMAFILGMFLLCCLFVCLFFLGHVHIIHVQVISSLLIQVWMSCGFPLHCQCMNACRSNIWNKERQDKCVNKPWNHYHMPKITKTVFSFANHTPQSFASKPVPRILHSQIQFGCSREIRFISRAITI